MSSSMSRVTQGTATLGMAPPSNPPPCFRGSVKMQPGPHGINVDGFHGDSVHHDDFELESQPNVVAISNKSSITESSAATANEKLPMAWQLFRWHSGSELFLTYVGIAFAPGAGGVQIGMGLFFGQATELFAEAGPGSWEKFLKVAWQLAGVAGATFTCASIYTWVLDVAAAKAMRRARLQYLEAILRSDTTWFDLHDPAALPTMIATNVQTLGIALGSKFGRIFQAFGQFGAGIVMAFTANWQLACVTLGMMPLMAGAAFWLSCVMAKMNLNNQAWYNEAGAVVEESLLALRTVVAFGAEGKQLARYRKSLEPARHQGIKMKFWFGCLFGLVIGLAIVSFALTMWLGGELIVKQDGKSGGVVLSVLFYLVTAFMGLSDFGVFFQPHMEGRMAAAKIIERIDANCDIEPRFGKKWGKNSGCKNCKKCNACQIVESIKLMETPPWMKHVRTIEFRNVHFTYPSRPDVPILKGINLTINAGQRVAFVGESGSGKSTLIQLLERFYDPSGGSVFINGMDLKDSPIIPWRQQIGYVGQEPFVFATSIKENIRQGQSGVSDDDIMQAAEWAQMGQMLKDLPNGIDTFVGHGGGGLSGGQKQRVAIARALVKKPAILLLDEATSALDNNSEKEVQKVIDNLAAMAGAADGYQMTTISIAHRLSTIKSCDEIFFIRDGAVSEKGSHEELMTLEGGYFNLVKAQGGRDEALRHDVLSSLRLESVPFDRSQRSVISQCSNRHLHVGRTSRASSRPPSPMPSPGQSFQRHTSPVTAGNVEPVGQMQLLDNVSIAFRSPKAILQAGCCDTAVYVPTKREGIAARRHSTDSIVPIHLEVTSPRFVNQQSHQLPQQRLTLPRADAASASHDEFSTEQPGRQRDLRPCTSLEVLEDIEHGVVSPTNVDVVSPCGQSVQQNDSFSKDIHAPIDLESRRSFQSQSGRRSSRKICDKSSRSTIQVPNAYYQNPYFMANSAAAASCSDASSVANIRDRLLAQGKLLDDETLLAEKQRIVLKSKQYKAPLARLFSVTKDVNGYLGFAFLSALGLGATFPAVGWFLTEAIIKLMVVPDLDADPPQCVTAFDLPDGTHEGTFVGEFAPCQAPLVISTESLRMSIASYTAIETLKISGYILALAVAIWITNVFLFGFLGIVGQTLGQRLREQTFGSMLKQDVAFHDHPDNSPGVLSNYLAVSAIKIADLTGPSTAFISQFVCSLILSCVLTMLASWQLSLVLSATAPILMIAIAFSMKMSAGSMNGGFGFSDSFTAAGAISSEAVLNVRTVRALAAEGIVLANYDALLQKPYQAQVRSSFKVAIFFGVSQSVFTILQVIGFVYGGYLVQEYAITTEDTIRCIVVWMWGLFGAGVAAAGLGDMNVAKLAAYDLFTIIDRPSKIDAVNPIGRIRDLGDGVIEFKNVKFSFPHRPNAKVLQGIDFKVRPGNLIALVGPSGSGKSTVIQLLLRFYDPSSGAVLVGGQDLRQFDIAWWRRQCGFVGQEPILFNVSLEENIRYGVDDATFEDVVAAAKLSNMDFVLGTNGAAKLIDWADSVGPKGSKLSGGQKQRVAIARAVIRNPKIMILDEATSALDSQSERIVQEALDTATQRRTTFTIAHRLSTIQHADKICVVSMGTIVESGTHESLMDIPDGLYMQLVTRGRQ